jgi:glutamyl-tRNA reductase
MKTVIFGRVNITLAPMDCSDMHILCLGLNHTTTPISLREQLSMNEEGIRAALSRLACGHDSTPLRELLLVSTCNRIELYAASKDLAFASLEAFLSETRGLPAGQFKPYCYRLNDTTAAQHLFEVAAGLDSLVIGEPQILGQVTRALELARGQNTAGPVLNRLFQAAIHAGKRARAETSISRNPASVSSLAAAAADEALADLQAAKVLVLGAGEMAELTVESLRKRGVQSLCVVNRTLERASGLAERWGAEATTFEFLEERMRWADILVSSTGAPHLMVSADMVARAMDERAERPMLLIDIALPRDIDPEAANLRGVRLIDLDGLNARLEVSLSERMGEVPQVRNILEEELAGFEAYLRSLDVLPLIASLRRKAESIRQAEVEKTLRHLPDLSDSEIERIDAMTQALVKKLLETPTHRLRESGCERGPEVASAARTLFGLESSHGD